MVALEHFEVFVFEQAYFEIECYRQGVVVCEFGVDGFFDLSVYIVYRCFDGGDGEPVCNDCVGAVCDLICEVLLIHSPKGWWNRSGRF